MSKLKETVHGVAVELGVESPVPEDQASIRAPEESRDSSSDPPSGADTAPSASPHEFAIHTSAGRIYIQNAAGKVIDVGELLEEKHVYGYRLDSGGIQGQGFGELGPALRHMASQLTFLYLESLFQRLPDDAAEASMHSISMPAVRISLAPGTDELRGPGVETVER